MSLNLNPAELSFFNGIINYVWVLKPLFGFVADTSYIFGYWWKPSLIIFSFLVSFGWLFMAFCVTDLTTAVIGKVMINIFLGFINSVSEGIMVELTA
jgi:hypothetical protein